MKVENRKIEELSPYERNAKKHGERQIQELTKSIQLNGGTLTNIVCRAKARSKAGE